MTDFFELKCFLKITAIIQFLEVLIVSSSEGTAYQLCIKDPDFENIDKLKLTSLLCFVLFLHAVAVPVIAAENQKWNHLKRE